MRSIMSTKDISGESYIALITYALRTSDAFMLIYYCREENQQLRFESKRVRLRLRPFRIKKRVTHSWPSTMTLDTHYTYTLEVYRSCPEAAEVLSEMGSLFSWNYPDYPLDLSFFTDNRCWLLTCAHEEFCEILIRSKEDRAVLSQMMQDFTEQDTDPDKWFQEEYASKRT